MTSLDFQQLTDKIILDEELSFQEILFLHKQVPLAELMHLGHYVRMQRFPEKVVTWMVDRNVNSTNVCFSKCSFCNFCVSRKDPRAYLTTVASYKQKIEELFALGGRQLLLQGGMHPDLGLSYYEELFSTLKQVYPDLLLHALGPPEIVYLAKKEGLSFRAVLQRLISSGLDSLPGAGAEILVDRVRNLISPAKASAEEWLAVMREAHQLGIRTSATMMMGHVETPEERIEHLLKLKSLQADKPKGAPGFVSFIPWTFQGEGTRLQEQMNNQDPCSGEAYIRLVALSRIVLNTIPHIQPSWLTVGKDVAQLCLWAGADDFGSVMIEENVVSSVGVSLQMNIDSMQEAIRQAGFEPRQRTPSFS